MVTGQEQRGFQVLSGQAELASVPCFARRFQRGRQVAGERLLRGIENLPRGRDRLFDQAGVERAAISGNRYTHR